MSADGGFAARRCLDTVGSRSQFLARCRQTTASNVAFDEPISRSFDFPAFLPPA